MRDRLLSRLLFTVSMLIAMGVTTALILAVAGHQPPRERLRVVPAATASAATPGR